MPKSLQIEYKIGDGYAGGDRPHSFTVDPEEFRGMDRDEIVGELVGNMTDHFQQHISPELKDEDAAVAAVMAAVANLPPE